MRCKAALALAICISENKASCIRAPPLAEKHTKGRRSAKHTFTALTKRRPATERVDPPVKLNSNAAAAAGDPRAVPLSPTSASCSPVAGWAAGKLALYVFEALDFEWSTG